MRIILKWVKGTHEDCGVRGRDEPDCGSRISFAEEVTVSCWASRKLTSAQGRLVLGTEEEPGCSPGVRIWGMAKSVMRPEVRFWERGFG